MVNQTFEALKLAQAPDKTFIGRIKRCFDFLGYRFGLPGLALAEKTLINAVNKVHQLYEQKLTAPERAAALDDYITRWLRWTQAGLCGLTASLTSPTTVAKASEAKTE